MKPIQADLFCRVIDNLGDIGVMWRLARQLTHEKYWNIRLWVDDLSALQRLVPAIDPEQACQQQAGIHVHDWSLPWPTTVEPRAVAIAGFSCDLPEPFLHKMAQQRRTTWLQLDYLSAEPWVSDFHGRPSPRTDGLTPIFFFPGFEAGTGGLLKEADLITERQQWQQNKRKARQWLQSLGVTGLEGSEAQEGRPKLVSLFCYPEAPLDALKEGLQRVASLATGLWRAPVKVLVPADVDLPSWVVEPRGERVSWHRIPFLAPADYDTLLWSMDLNFVRGEDSFVRAIWAGRPLVWQPYAQPEKAHLNKLNAWLARTGLPPEAQDTMSCWADRSKNDYFASAMARALSPDAWRTWEAASEAHSQRLARQTDLASQIDHLCQGRPVSDHDG